jgi:murein DD-endopeptidase MepM/ murein hydrolase activator NlpD
MSLSSALLRDTFKRSSLDDNLVTLRKSTIGARKASIKAVKVFRKKDNVGTTIYRKERRLNQLFRFRQERRNRESALEASSVPGSGLVSRTLNKGKGFLGRIMNALGYLLLGWLVGELPRILALIETLKVRIGNIVQAAKRMIQDIRNIIGGLKGVVTQTIANIKNFDFTDKEGKLQREIDNLDAAVASLGTNWNDVVYNAKNLTTPEEKKQKPEESGSGQGQAQQTPPPTPPVTQVPSGRTVNAQALLDTISYAEGTSDPAGYNKWFGGRTDMDLSKMTINEVVAEQKKRQRERDPSARFINAQGKVDYSFAVGKYQILFPEVAAVKAGFDPAVDKFTPENQDKMAIVKFIMGQAGLTQKEIDGPLTPKVIDKLAPVFASFPNLFGPDKFGRYGTKSSYFGQGGKSQEELEKYYSSRLNSYNSSAIKSPPTQQIPPPVQPQQPPQTTAGSLMPLSGTTGSAYAPQGKGASVSIPTSPILKSKPGAYTPKITSGMGKRWGKSHNGIDVGASRGTQLFSYLPGKVYQTGRLGASNDGGYGNWVTWKDDKFNAYHFFGHMNAPSPLRRGEKFGAQTMLGTVGGSGWGNPNEYADHLHWEISNSPPDAMGNFRPPTDPITWMNKNFRGVENQRTISKGRTSSGQRVAIVPIEIPVAQPIPVGSSSQTIASSTKSAPDMLNKLGNIQLAYT